MTKSTVIAAAHYAETEARLMDDPIVIQMAIDISNDPNRDKVVASFKDSSGGPAFSFMQAANRRYQSLGGTIAGHIGAVATAILALLK